MRSYIIQRIKNDALHLRNQSENEEQVQHSGLRGRFRELLVDNILSPWLPPYIACGTGSIISGDQVQRKYSQDDIILFDRSLTPPVLASEGLREGVFLFNCVIARIEVKSTARSEDISKFCESCLELSEMKFSVKSRDVPTFTGPLSLFFAYKSDCIDDFMRFTNTMKKLEIDPFSGKISMICIPGKGFWKLAKRENQIIWEKLDSDDPLDHIAWFVACISNTCYETHAIRQGRDPNKTLEMGIGSFFPGDCYSKVY